MVTHNLLDDVRERVERTEMSTSILYEFAIIIETLIIEDR